MSNSLPSEPLDDEREPILIGNAEPLRQILQMCAQIAGVDSNVLIQGETGTGKSLLAHHPLFASICKIASRPAKDCKGCLQS